MKATNLRWTSAWAIGIWMSASLAQVVPPAPPEVTVTRLDCGVSLTPSDVARFSDTYAYKDFKVQLTYSCYLVKHGDDYLVWDAGNAIGTPTVKVSIVEQLGNSVFRNYKWNR